MVDSTETHAAAPPEASPGLTREAVTWAYRLFLDREPDDPAIVSQLVESVSDTRHLRRLFMDSSEYRGRGETVPLSRPTKGNKPLKVEDQVEGEALVALLTHITQTWTQLGVSEPYWSVLSAEEFRKKNITDTLHRFRDSGRSDAQWLRACLARNGFDHRGLKVVLEYGCGVGRVTRWLSDLFAAVYAFDISATHLDLARNYLREEGRQNVELRRIGSPGDLSQLPQADVVYSFLVLQHNPPPLIALMFRALLGALKPGGIAVLQVPTYNADYSFNTADYLRSTVQRQRGTGSIEVHLLPQSRVFQLVAESRCRVLEVSEDTAAGPSFISTTFVIQRD